MSSGDITDFGSLRTAFFSKQNQIISQQKELSDIARSLSSTPQVIPLLPASLKSRVTQLNTDIESFKQDIEKIKSLHKSENTSLQIQIAFQTDNLDILAVLDNAKEALSKAQSQLESVQKQYNLKAEALDKELKDTANPFDTFWSTGELSPDEFLQYGKANIEKNPKLAQRCFEKAAQLYLNENQLEKALSIRKQMAELFPLTSSHPLYDLEKIMKERVMPPLTLSEQGLNVSELGSGELKRGQMNFRHRSLDGKPALQATFQLTHPAKDHLNQFCESISRDSNLFEKCLPDEIKGKVTIKEVDDGYQGCATPAEYSTEFKHGIRLGKVFEIRIDGVGVIRIGSNTSVECSYRRVTVELAAGMEAGKAMKQLSSLLTMIGVGPALVPESKEEEERKKIAFLFRTIFPKEAFKLEHSLQFYEMSTSQMKLWITRTVPEMGEIFSKYLTDPSLLTKVEIIPGETAWSLNPLSKQLRERGGVGLMTGFQGTPETLAKVIIQGSLCSEKRFEAGLIETKGTSSTQDIMSGGAVSVFTRMITKLMIDREVKNPFPDEIDGINVQASLVRRFPWAGDIQLLYDLDAVNRGAYAYNEDIYGSKSPSHYSERQNLLEFTAKLDEKSVKNEVMLLHGIPPTFLKKILVRSQFSKDNLIQELAKIKEICEEINDKHYLIGYNGPALEDLIIVGKYFQEKMWE